jgi:hypothetical protein
MSIVLFAGQRRKVDVKSMSLRRTGGSTFELTVRTTGGEEIRLMKDTSGKLDRIDISIGDDGSTRVIVQGKGIK